MLLNQNEQKDEKKRKWGRDCHKNKSSGRNMLHVTETSKQTTPVHVSGAHLLLVCAVGLP